MKIEKIRETVEGLPHMTFEQAKRMSEFILETRPRRILELGFKHGVSTCYMAAALDELGEGKITTIDRLGAKDLQPNADALLQKLGLQKYATVFYEPTSYIWRLMKFLEEDPEPVFDLCYLDGAHSWFVDGFAFFLVDRLLKKDGWIIFDDLNWTYGTSEALRNTDLVRRMPAEERDSCQIRKVFDLLVTPHPCYGDFKIEKNWGFAHKLSSSPLEPVAAQHRVLVEFADLRRL